MKKQIRRKIEMGDRVIEFGNHPELAPTPAITALFAFLATLIATLKAWGSDQSAGRGIFRGGALERRRLASETRAAMREIAEIAKVLTPAVAPGAREIFRMPGTVSFQALLASARHFAEQVEPLKALFIARGLAATFVEDLETLITAFDAATATKAGGLSGQVGGTAGMDHTARAVMQTVQELRATLRVHLKAKPAVLEAFRSAARVESSTPAAPTAPPPPSTPAP